MTPEDVKKAVRDALVEDEMRRVAIKEADRKDMAAGFLILLVISLAAMAVALSVNVMWRLCFGEWLFA